MTKPEMDARGWAEFDVLLVTADAYVDHPSFGAAMIGRLLEAEGRRGAHRGAVRLAGSPDPADRSGPRQRRIAVWSSRRCAQKLSAV
jgi:hypothetical protein